MMSDVKETGHFVTVPKKSLRDNPTRTLTRQLLLSVVGGNATYRSKGLSVGVLRTEMAYTTNNELRTTGLGHYENVTIPVKNFLQNAI